MNIENEIWKPIHMYAGMYEISNLGRVKSLERMTRNNHKVKTRILIPDIGTNGYCQVQLCVENVRKKMLIHKLVASAYISNHENKPCVNHKDGCRVNNNVDNLEWCTYSENEKHKLYKIGNNSYLRKLWIGEHYSENPMFINNIAVFDTRVQRMYKDLYDGKKLISYYDYSTYTTSTHNFLYIINKLIKICSVPIQHTLINVSFKSNTEKKYKQYFIETC